MGGDLVTACKIGMALMGIQAPAPAPVGPGIGLASALTVEEVTAGSGYAAKAGDRVTVDFTLGTHDGKEIANTQKRGLTYTLLLGAPNTSPLWQSLLSGAQAGSQRRVSFSGDAVFGPEGLPPFIGPGMQVQGTVKVLRVVRVNSAETKVAVKGRG